jgi:hypothetical protein
LNYKIKMDSSEYSTVGKNSVVQNYLADPVQDCLAGNFFNGADNPLRYDIGRCNTFMSQRCARQWDGYCDIFLNEQENADFTGKAANEFLTSALDSQFCRVNNSIKGASNTCYTKCEQMDPLAPDSAQICQTNGNFVYRNTDKMYNIDTQFNALGQLNTPSPIRIAACPKVCDSLSDNPEKLSNNNRVLNECLDRGIAGEILQNIAENAVSNGIEVTNERFKRFINSFILTNKSALTPGFSSLGASPMLTTFNKPVPTENPIIQPGKQYFKTSNTNFGPQLVDSSPYSTMTKLEALPPKESFHMTNKKHPRYVTLDDSVSVNNITVNNKEHFHHRREDTPIITQAPEQSTTNEDQSKNKIIKIMCYTGISILLLVLLYVLFYMK